MHCSNKWIICVIAICIILFFLFVDRVPPYSYTITTISCIGDRINTFFIENNKLPGKLSGLPPREGYNNSLEDYWGREIIYEYDSELNIKLISYGKDGKVGGVGDNADIIEKFRVPLGLNKRCQESFP